MQARFHKGGGLGEENQIKLIFSKMNLVFIVSLLLIVSFTLYLVRSPLGVIFSVFEIVFAFLVLNALVGSSWQFEFKVKFLSKRESKKITFMNTCAFPLLAFILIAFFVLSIFIEVNNSFFSILGFLISTFISGYLLSSILNLGRNRSHLENIVLAYSFGVPVVALISICTLFVPESSRSILQAASLLGLALVALIQRLKDKEPNPNQDFTINITSAHFLLILTLGFVCGAILLLYPAMNFKVGVDPVTNFMNARIASRTPDLALSGSPWFSLYLGTTFLLSQMPVESFKTFWAFLVVLEVLAFYTMVSAFSDKNKRMASLSTFFWTLFSGFGWVFVLIKSLFIGVDPSSLATLAFEHTYWDTYYGQGSWLWLWNRPLTVGFSLFFTALYLLKRDDLSRKSFLASLTLLTLAMSLVHLPEFLIFAVLLGTLNILRWNSGLRMFDASLAISLAMVCILLNSTLQNPLFVAIPYPSTFLNVVSAVWIFTIVALIFGFLLAKKDLYNQLRSFALRVTQFMLRHSLVILVGIYTVTTVYWLANMDAFSAEYVKGVLAIPWYMYPILLGVLGLLASAAFTKHSRHALGGYKVFLLLLIVALLISRFVTFANLNLFYTGYWERRLFLYVFVSCSVFASLGLISLVDNIRGRMTLVKWKTVVLVAVALILPSGLSTTFFAINGWYYTLNSPSGATLGEYEKEAVFYMRDWLDGNPRSRALAITERSINELAFMAPARTMVLERFPILSSQRPEVPMLMFEAPLYNSTILYLHSRDKSILTSKFESSWLLNHVAALSPLIYNNSATSFFVLPQFTPPSTKSPVALVTNLSQLDKYELALYDALSTSGLNYTVELSAASDLMDYEGLVLPGGDSLIINDILDESSKGNLDFVIALNTGELDRLIEYDTLTIADDNMSEFWSGRSFGQGNISIPTLVDSTLKKTSGQQGLLIYVIEGNYSQWELFHKYAQPVDWESFDQICFDWFGKDDGKRYVFEILAPDENNRFWYEFIDSWYGWKEVKIPLDIEDGSHILSEIQMQSIKIGNPRRDEVEEIRIRLSSVNSNMMGNWALDNIRLISHSVSVVYGEPAAHMEKIRIGQNEIPLVTPLKVKPLRLRGNVETLSWYEGQNSSIPLLLAIEKGDLKIFYFYSSPIFDGLNKETNEPLFSIVGSVLALVLNSSNSHTYNEDIMDNLLIFGNCTNEGSTVAHSNSIAFDNHVDIESLRIYSNGANLTIHNVTKINVAGVDEVYVEVDNATIGQGNGFYAALKGNASIVLLGDEIFLHIQTKESNTHEMNFYGSLGLDTRGEFVSIYLREPRIELNGSIVINEVSAYGALRRQLKLFTSIDWSVELPKLTISGSVTFSILLSDTQTLVKHFELTGDFERFPPLMELDERESILQAIPLFVLFAIGIYVAKWMKKLKP